MEIRLKEGEDYIKLGQLLKLTGLASSGVEAKIYITEGEVQVNGEVETRRGRKICVGDCVTFDGQKIKVVQ